MTLIPSKFTAGLGTTIGRWVELICHKTFWKRFLHMQSTDFADSARWNESHKQLQEEKGKQLKPGTTTTTMSCKMARRRKTENM